MPYVLSPLPFGLDSLTPHMSAETLAVHHGKHHQAYADKTSELAAATGVAGHSLVEVIGMAGPGALFSNACQLWNHNFFWQCLTPDPAAPAGELARLIDDSFGSTEALLKDFAAQANAHFGSGWAWLVLEHGKLAIQTLHDGDAPAAHAGTVPLFTLDVWEHAYYIDYRNARPAYTAAILGNLVNWAFVAGNLDGQGIARGDQAWLDAAG